MTDYLALPPAREVRGTVIAPPSKSATNRALILAALSPERVELVCPLDSEDTRALAGCLTAMGVAIAPSARGLTVKGPPGSSGGREVALDAADSGTAARFLAALCAAVPGRYLLTGSVRLRQRPMEELLAALRSAGAQISCTGREGYLPVAIRGATLSPGSIAVDASRSSQFFSALLLAGVALEGGLEVSASGSVVSAPYVAVTLETLRAFGHSAREESGVVRVARGPAAPSSYDVPGDYSSALPLLAAAGVAGGDVTVERLGWPSAQADALALPVLERMGMGIEKDTSKGSVRARADRGALRAVTADAGAFPDAVPTLAALAALAPGTSRFERVGHLRFKESDRIGSLAALLEVAGAGARAETEALSVDGPLRPATGRALMLPTAGDHRIAMAAALLSLALPDCLVENPACVAKSYPAFFRDLATIVQCEP